jgi:hypothetical protein
MSELREALQAEYVYAEESWASLWPEAGPLAAAHFSEVEAGLEPRRKYKVDTEAFAYLNLQGILKIMSAREVPSGRLVAYITWMLQPDLEAMDLGTVALMGPWYAEPGTRTGGPLFDKSLDMLRELGIQCVFPHHRTQGRGAELGSFFKLRGAKHIQQNYLLWIGDK